VFYYLVTTQGDLSAWSLCAKLIIHTETPQVQKYNNMLIVIVIGTNGLDIYMYSLKVLVK